MTILFALLVSFVHLVLLVALPVVGAVNVIRRPRRTGYIFLCILSVVAGLAGALGFGAGVGLYAGLTMSAMTFLFGSVAGEYGRRRVPFSEAAFRTLVTAVAPLAFTLAAYAAFAGGDFYPSIRQFMESMITQAIDLQKQQGALDDATLKALEAAAPEQAVFLTTRAYMMPGTLLAAATGWFAICLMQVAKFSGVWTRDDLYNFRLPEWLMVPALLGGLATGAFGLSAVWTNHYHVAMGFLYVGGVLYAAQGVAVTATFFRHLGVPAWLAVFALITLFPAVLAAGVMDMWADFRGRMAKWGTASGPPGSKGTEGE